MDYCSQLDLTDSLNHSNWKSSDIGLMYRCHWTTCSVQASLSLLWKNWKVDMYRDMLEVVADEVDQLHRDAFFAAGPLVNSHDPELCGRGRIGVKYPGLVSISMMTSNKWMVSHILEYNPFNVDAVVLKTLAEKILAFHNLGMPLDCPFWVGGKLNPNLIWKNPNLRGDIHAADLECRPIKEWTHENSIRRNMWVADRYSYSAVKPFYYWFPSDIPHVNIL